MTLLGISDLTFFWSRQYIKSCQYFKRMPSYGNISLSPLTLCKDSAGSYLGPKTKIFCPLRTTPLNTLAKAMKDSLLSASCFAAFEVTTSIWSVSCCSSPNQSYKKYIKYKGSFYFISWRKTKSQLHTVVLHLTTHRKTERILHCTS